MNFQSYFFLTVFLLFFANQNIFSQKANPLEGRWDLVIDQNGQKLPSWLEVTHSGNKTLVGRFVYAFGSARPVAEVKEKDGKFSFAIPPQWEPGDRYMEFEGQLEGEQIKGTMVYTDGKTYTWEGSRAPVLPHTSAPVWGEALELFNGKDLKGWHAGGEKNQWVVESSILKSPKSGVNLISDEAFMDFKLHVEFRYPKGSNSGIYLRGRYEVQIEDGFGKEPSDIYFAGVYGFLTPNQMAAKPAGEWQTYDITLIGNRVTIVANGIAIISDQIIPGITGGAIDSHEAAPGKFLIQGDHGPVEFRKFVVTPLKN